MNYPERALRAQEDGMRNINRLMAWILCLAVMWTPGFAAAQQSAASRTGAAAAERAVETRQADGVDLAENSPAPETVVPAAGEAGPDSGETASGEAAPAPGETDPAPGEPTPAPEPPLAQSVTLTTETGENWVLVEGTLRLLARVEPEGAVQQVSWEVSDPTVAIIGQEGVLTGLKVGWVKVRALAQDGSGVFGEIDIQVRPILVERIQLEPQEKQLMAGGSWPVKATVWPDNATDPTVAWVSSDPASAWIEVGENGQATLRTAADAVGRKVILYARAQDAGGAQAQMEVQVVPAVSDILVGMSDGGEAVSRILRGDSLTLAAQVLPSDASQEILWRSSDPAVASVSREDGRAVVSGVGGGNAVISALAQDGSGAIGTYELFVRVPVEAITLPAAAQVFVDGELSLVPDLAPEDTTDRVVRWSCANPSVATVDGNGVVRGLSVGAARVTARSAADASVMGECLVWVSKPVTTILLEAEQKVLGVGGSMRINAVVSPLDAGDRSLEWHSSHPLVAQVDETGVVTGVAPGTASIQALARDGSGAVGVFQVEVRGQLESIALPEAISVAPGQTVPMTLTVVPYGLDPGLVLWQSQNPAVAVVSQEGAVTGVSQGETVLTASCTQDGLTAQCRVTVSDTLSGIQVYTERGLLAQGETQEIDVGQTLWLLAQAQPAGVDAQITFKSAAPKVAQVDEKGVVRANKTGKTRIIITARAAQGGTQVTRQVQIQVIQPVTGVELPQEILVLKGGTAQAKAQIIPAAATHRQLAWATLDSQVATVNAKGVVTGVNPGQTLLTAMSHNRLVGKCIVTVKEPAVSLTIQGYQPEGGPLNPGDELQLTYTAEPEQAGGQVTWKSSNPSVVSVNQQGKVVAKKKGSARITATAGDGSGVKATLKITVAPAVKRVAINKSSLTLFLNGTGKLVAAAQLKAKVTPADASGRAVTWLSTDEKVATVDQRGWVSAVGDGVSIITACTENGHSDSLAVQVLTLPSYIRLSDQQMTLVVGETANLAKGLSLDGSDGQLTWTSSKPAVAKVDKNGYVTGRKSGKAIITVTTRNGLNAKCQVQVIKPAQVTPSPAPHDTPQPTPQPTPGADATPGPTPSQDPSPDPIPGPTPTPSSSPVTGGGAVGETGLAGVPLGPKTGE